MGFHAIETLDPAPNIGSLKTSIAQCSTATSGYRYYSPALGRWLSRDPIGEKGGRNLYCFARNRPLSRADRLGLEDYEIGDPSSGNDDKNAVLTVTVDGVDLCDLGKAGVVRLGLVFTLIYPVTPGQDKGFKVIIDGKEVSSPIIPPGQNMKLSASYDLPLAACPVGPQSGLSSVAFVFKKDEDPELVGDITGVFMRFDISWKYECSKEADNPAAECCFTKTPFKYTISPSEDNEERNLPPVAPGK